MVDVACPSCGTVYHSEESHLGKQLRCVKCGFLVPIVVNAERPAVVRHAPATPQSSKHTDVPGVTEHPKRWIRRRYQFAIAVAVLGVIGVWGVFVRRPRVAPKAAPTIVDARELPQAQESQKIENGGTRQSVAGVPIPAPGSQPSTDLDKRNHPAIRKPTFYNSLPTGTRIEPDLGINGHGKLAVQNGTNEDAVVRLSDVATDQTVRWFFVRAHTSGRVAQIPVGKYRLAFTTGLNWIESEDVFGWRPSYGEFERILDYSEQRDSEGVQYHTISVTLHPVLFGNVRTKAISREEFLKGHHHVNFQP